MKLQTLYRPVGEKEFNLIKQSGYRKFPPRLEWQPIFYPVLNQAYAEQIASEWNANDEFSGYAGYVTAFDMPEQYVKKFPVQNVGGEIHNELWVQAKDLEEFNRNIVGEIRIVKYFSGENAKLTNMANRIKGALFGLAVGDALGVPVEFISREKLKLSPVKQMTGFGSWNQPAGTWSDDSSLAFCLAESLAKGYDLDDMAQNFINWMQHGFWGAHHKVFDIGAATREAIGRLAREFSPLKSGCFMEEDNGNGSLMQIMPLLFYIKDLDVDERFSKVKEVSSITHAHFRSVFSCFIYMELALQILQGNDISNAYRNMQQTLRDFAIKKEFSGREILLFTRILQDDIGKIEENAIHSSGYVLHTLEASIWCLMNTDSYEEAVLKAVNLGGDTDTTGCVTGGLAGLFYGYENIPAAWVNAIARKNDIEDLCSKFSKEWKRN